MMWQDKLKKLIEILEKSNISEIEVSFWGKKYRVAKYPSILAHAVKGEFPKTSHGAIHEAGVQQEPSSPHTAIQTSSQTQVSISPLLTEIKAPMVGTFYRSSSPESAPFVKVGDSIEVGRTLCIIEAMKIMNEIESEVKGTIKEILIEDAQPVEYGQTLFTILLEGS